MSFWAYLPYITKGLQAFEILSEQMPVILHDKKISINEVVSMVTDLAELFGMPVNIIVPEDFKYKYFDVSKKGES
ncbi:MAG: hypothetical protein SV775_17930 [Thermodesulfobacteriota bacterium]|nr:hypothetical protein [Thermodesulfobacteriota bacterium]